MNTSERAWINLEAAGKRRRLELIPSPGDDTWQVLLDGMCVEVNARILQPGILGLIIDGKAYRCFQHEGPAETAVEVNGVRVMVAVDDPRSLAARRQRRGASGGDQVISAPMPGRILRVLVVSNQEVEAHQALIAIEAMKMQNELKALRAGTVREIRVGPGNTVAAGEILMVLE